MKKSVIILIVVSIISLWIVAGFTHALEIYTIPTTASEPTYRPGSVVIASSLKKVNNNDFVVFKSPDKGVWIFRCIGKEGDIIEMKNAIVYINGKQVDEPFVWNEYYISNKQLQSIEGYVQNNNNTIRAINDSVAIGNFTTTELKDYHLNLKLFLSKDAVNIFPVFKKLEYDQDNFGPIKIPKDSYFLLGDSRHDAYDSRYFGFVKADDIISTVLR